MRAKHLVASPLYRDELPSIVREMSAAEPGLAIGLGRSYGTSGLNPLGSIVRMTRLDRLITFDRQSGRIRAEAGASLSDILQILVPSGWFLPTTPGTRFVTLGGAVANDVHGKNHHKAGAFGNSVSAIGLIRGDGESIELRPEDALFSATVGGLGLTGLIEWVEFQAVPISSAYLEAENIPFENLESYFKIAEESDGHFEHCVAWIDCLSRGRSLGRGIYSRANWAQDGELKAGPETPRFSMPIELPGIAMNKLSIGMFNSLYNWVGKNKPSRQSTHYNGFFYPLDAIANWNRMYGRSGFYQYQCVVGPLVARDAIRELLLAISKEGLGSFLAVLKNFGAIPARGLLSFPMEGTTLALDFPNKKDITLKLLSRLDDIVREAGGRLYAAKDGRMSREMFHAGYPNADAFLKFIDPAFSSGLFRNVFETQSA